MSQLQVVDERPLTGSPARQPHFYARVLPWLIIAAGVAVRLFHFWYNRSLYYDEAHIALNLIYRDYAGLASPPLDFDQQAPLGFLWASKWCTTLFGNSEYGLRLFALLCGLLALPLFYRLVRQLLPAAGVNVALTCLAFAPPLVYHSVEVKQYETEMLATIVAFLAYFHYKDRPGLAPAVKWGLAGAGLVWFSLASVFILAGIGITAGVTALRQGGVKKSLPLLVTGGLWGASFLVNYVLFVSAGTEIAWLKEHWERQDAFMPLPPRGLGDLLWFPKIAFKALDYPLGINWQFLPDAGKALRFSLLGTLFFGIGLGQAVRRREVGWAFAAPLLIVLAASAFKVYPVLERLLVFAAPILIVFIAFGAQAVYAFFERRSRPAVGLVLLLVFAAAPVANAARQLVRPETLGGGKQIDLRQALQYVQAHRQAADQVYVTSSFENPFRYYRQLYRYPWDKLPVRETFDNLMPSPDVDAYKQQVRTSLDFTRPGRRVWVVLYPMQLKYLDAHGKVQVTDRLVSDVVKAVLDEKGVVENGYAGTNIFVYLYQF
ncbi:MAG: glycosyltransferase family 39 protein [Cytophagales bacterium]|nr:glycosyltransferase family 39 protein [Cytophagales bacterium]